MPKFSCVRGTAVILYSTILENRAKFLTTSELNPSSHAIGTMYQWRRAIHSYILYWLDCFASTFRICPEKDGGNVALRLPNSVPSFLAISSLIWTVFDKGIFEVHVSQKCGMQFS